MPLRCPTTAPDTDTALAGGTALGEAFRKSRQHVMANIFKYVSLLLPCFHNYTSDVSLKEVSQATRGSSDSFGSHCPTGKSILEWRTSADLNAYRATAERNEEMETKKKSDWYAFGLQSTSKSCV